MNKKRKANKANKSNTARPVAGGHKPTDAGTRAQPPGSGWSRRMPARYRWLALAAFSVVSATLVIVAVVALTPLDADLSQEAALGRTAPLSLDTQALDTQSTSPALTQPTTPQVSSLVAGQPDSSSTAAGGRRSQRVFPAEAEAIDVAKLQQELKALAETLQTQYADAPLAAHFAAQIHFELKQTKLAEAAWRQCIEQNVVAAGPFAGLAELLNNAGREQETIEMLSAAHADGIQSVETLLRLAEAQENLGLLDDARVTLEAAVELSPAAADAWLAYGRVLTQLQQYEHAEESVLRSLDLAGDSEAALFALSTAQARQNKMEAATATRDRLTQLRNSKAQQGDSFQDSYESALRRIAAEILLSSSALAAELQRQPQAEAYAWRAIELEPQNTRAYMAYIAALRSQSRWGDAFDAQQQLVKIQPNNPLNYVNLASLATQLGEIQVARTALQKAIALDPDGIPAQNSLVRLHMALGEVAEAEQIANNILQQHPSVEAYVMLASVLEAAGRLAAAQHAIAQAKLLNPSHPLWTEH